MPFGAATFTTFTSGSAITCRQSVVDRWNPKRC
jgi:hypothetical protein